MKNKSLHNLFGLLLLALLATGCDQTAEKKQYTVRFLNLDGSEIASKKYVEGHTIVPPDDIRDYDVKSECHRYIFKGYFDGDTAFKIGTKATKDVVYQAKFDIKDKHIFESVSYSWGETKEHEDECKAKATCLTCMKEVEETAWTLQEIDKTTPCYIQYHYDAFFDTIGFEEQHSESIRNKTGEHAFTKMWAKDTIGNSGTYYCDHCGDPNPNPSIGGTSSADEVNFAFDTFGAKAALVGNWGAYKGEGKDLPEAFKQDLTKPKSLLVDLSEAEKYTTGYAEFKLELPKVNYALYSEVKLDISISDATYGVTFSDHTWNEPDTAGAIQGLFLTVSLEVKDVSGAYKASMTSNGVTIDRKTVLEPEIVNGEKGLMFCVNSMFFRDVTFSGLSLTAK